MDIYSAGDHYTIAVKSTDTAATLLNKLAAAVNADPDAIGAVSVDTAASRFTFECKEKGVYGNEIRIEVAARPDLGETDPADLGVHFAKTAAVAGVGVPDVAASLAAMLGTGETANELHITDIVHGFGLNNDVLNALSNYNGAGQTATGLYADTVSRPFRALTAVTFKLNPNGTMMSGGDFLAALIAYAGTRKQDRTNGILCPAGELYHPAEIAANAVGAIALVSNSEPAKPYVGLALTYGGERYLDRKAGRDWTIDYAKRDNAVNNGISPVSLNGGSATLENVVSLFRPDDMPKDSNAYREFSNIAKVQNILYNIRAEFGSAYWKAFITVGDKMNVTDITARGSARDLNDAKARLLQLCKSFLSLGWLYRLDETLAAIQAGTAVAVRSGGDGFTINFPAVLSGVGNIMDVTVYIDTKVAAA